MAEASKEDRMEKVAGKPPHRPELRAKMQAIGAARREVNHLVQTTASKRVAARFAAVAVHNGVIAEWTLKPAHLAADDGCGCGCGCSCGCSCNVLV
jgi:hypothetical protein